VVWRQICVGAAVHDHRWLAAQVAGHAGLGQAALHAAMLFEHIALQRASGHRVAAGCEPAQAQCAVEVHVA
jgi:hypothetical protein